MGDLAARKLQKSQARLTTSTGASPAPCSNVANRKKPEAPMMTAAPRFRIDVAINDLLTTANQRPPAPAEAGGLILPTPVFP